MRFSTRIVRNALANYFGSFVAMAAGLVLTPFMIHRLGDAQYGLWNLMLSIFTWFNLLDLGLSAAVARHVAKCEALDDRERLSQIVSTLFFAYLVIGGLVLAPVFVLAPGPSRLFRIPASYESLAAIVFVISGLNFAVGFPAGVLSAALVGYQRLDLNNLVQVVTILINTVLVVIFLSLGFDLTAVALITLAITSLTLVLRLYFLTRADRSFRLNPRFFRRAIIARLVAYGVFVFLIYVGAGLQFEMSSMVIGHFMSVSQITPFAVARRLGYLVLNISLPLSGVLFPAFSELGATMDFDRARRLLLEGTRVSVAVGLPLALVLMIMAEPIISLWVGSQYRTSAPIAVVLIATVFITLVYNTSSNLLLGMGRHRVLAAITLLDGLLNLILSVVLIQIIGLIGVALAALIPLVLISLVLITRFACATVNLSISRFVTEVGRVVLIPGCALLVTGYLLMRVWYPDTLWCLGVELMACFAVYGVFYFRGLGEQERDTYLTGLRNLLRPQA